MAEETWTVKGVSITGDVVHEGFLEKAGEGGFFRSRDFKKRWFKLLFRQLPNKAYPGVWLLYFEMGKKFETSTTEYVLNNVISTEELASHLTLNGVIVLHRMKYLEHRVDTGNHKNQPGFDIHPNPERTEETRIWHICFCDGETFDDPLGWVSAIIARMPNIVTYTEKKTTKSAIKMIPPRPLATLPVIKSRKIDMMVKESLTLLGGTERKPNDCYLVTRTLAQGGTGKIRYAMRLAGSEELLAVKVIRIKPDGILEDQLPGKKRATDWASAKEALDEPKLMVNLGCRVKIYETITVQGKPVVPSVKYEPQKAYLIMPAHYDFKYCLTGNIGNADLKLIGRYLLCEVAGDLVRCHTHKTGKLETPYVHCDLKPGNIFVDENGVIMLADYGGALPAGVDQSQASPYYCPSKEWKDTYFHPVKNKDKYYIKGNVPTIAAVGNDVFALAISWMQLLARKEYSQRLCEQVYSFPTTANDKGALWTKDELIAHKIIKDIANIDKEVLEILWPHVLRQPTSKIESITKLKVEFDRLLPPTEWPKARKALSQIIKSSPAFTDREKLRTVFAEGRKTPFLWGR
jgi:serine/threonine protein kinase